MKVMFKFNNGETVTVDVPQKLTSFFMEEKKRTDNDIKKSKRYIDMRGMDSYAIESQLITEELEEVFCRKLKLKVVIDTLERCTPKQRRRFQLYYFCGYSYEEIAQTEKCSIQAIGQSIKTVLHKIEKEICMFDRIV